MLIKSFSTASTQHIKQKDMTICYVSSWDNDFFQVFKNANVFVNSVISHVAAVSISVDIIARLLVCHQT